MSVESPKIYIVRNELIFYEAVAEEIRPSELGRKYGISINRIKQIILREARRRAPKLYYDLILMRYDYCQKNNLSQGPTIFELKRFKDIFLYGDI